MDKLKKYISDELSEAELDKISGELITAKLDKDKEEAWMKKLAQEYDVHRSANPAPTSNTKSKIWLIIGLLLTLFLSALLYYWFRPQAELPVEKQAIQYIAALNIIGDQSSLLRGDGKEVEERILANEAYAQQNYEEALMNWEKLNAKVAMNKMDYFYAGLCYLKQTNSTPKLAIENLKISKALDGPFDEINWVLSLAYLQAGAKEEAKKLLHQIAKNKAYQHQKAALLLEQMNKNNQQKSPLLD